MRLLLPRPALLMLLGFHLALAAETPSTAQQGKTLWDEWYVTTLNGKTRYGYYNERVEARQGKVYFKSDVWKKEEDYLNREALGGVAEDSETLAPLFFNFHSVYRTTETDVDGNVANGILTLKARRGGRDLPVTRKGLSRKTFFSVFFPLWLGRNVAGAKPGTRKSFVTVFEDGLDNEFASFSGSATVDKPDERAQKTGSTRIRVEHRGIRSTWWVDARGAALRIEMPEQKMVVERVDKSTAIRFLTPTGP